MFQTPAHARKDDLGLGRSGAFYKFPIVVIHPSGCAFVVLDLYVNYQVLSYAGEILPGIPCIRCTK